MINQPGHFFDRVAARDAGAAGVLPAFVFVDDVTGRYFLADTAVVAGATRVYFHDRDDYPGRVSLDTAGDGARTATLFGDDVVQL